MKVKNIVNVGLVLVIMVSMIPQHNTFARQPVESIYSSTGPATSTSTPDTIAAVPAPTNGPTPTVHLSITHGYVGQEVTVTGNVPSNAYQGVRVSWVISDTTYTAAVVDRDATLAYQAAIGVPHTLLTGPAKICAALTGVQIAEYACQAFTLDTPPDGSVSGSIPLALLGGGAPGSGPGTAALGAMVNLMDRGGNILYSGGVAVDGSFTIQGVSPGFYQVAVTGSVAQPVVAAPVTVNPGIGTLVNLTPAITIKTDPVTGELCAGNFSAQVSAVHNTATTNTYWYQLHYLPFNFTLGNMYNSTPHNYDFGIYLNGVSVPVPFSSYLQVTTGFVVSEVQYHVMLPNGTIVPIGSSSDSGSNYSLTYDVGNLSAGTSKLIVSPVVSGVRQCPSLYKIKVMEDPMKDPIMQPGASTTWDSSHNRYTFQGTLVNVGGLLPLLFPDPAPSLPLVGTLTNEFSAGVKLSGNITLDGVIHIQMMQAEALAKLFSITVFDDKADLLKSGTNTVSIDPNNPLNSSIGFGPATLWSDSITTTVYSGVIASFWGIVSIDASVSVGLAGQLTISGTIYPFQPNLDATLVTTITPSLTISLWIDILLGIASAGADATAAVGFGLPLRVSTNDPSHPEVVWIDTPCFSLSVTLSVWAKVNLLFWSQKWNIGSYDLVKYSNPDGCTALAQAIKEIDPNAVIAPPRMMASPAVGTSPDGQALSVYIVDTTPNQQQPTPKVAASFWEAATNSWGAPAYLTDGDHAVQDPVAAFVGPANTPMVVWTQTDLTLAEEQTMGSDMNAYTQKQEIFFTTWNGSSWDTPSRLTNDSVPDGRASIAGDSTGATLAWVKNTGGLISAPQKMRIAVTDWTPNVGMPGGTWGTIELLNGNGQSDAMNVQPSVARVMEPTGLTIKAVAWTVDVDGNPSTNADRRIVVARNSGNGWASPTFDLTSQLPAGAESPSLSFDPMTSLGHMAFIVRGVDGDGMTDTGVGNRAILWSADANVDTFWSGAQVRDGNQMIYAEKPVLQISGSGERLLLFRRFGTPGTNAVLGQLALSQGLMAGGYSSPLYMTDAPVNHWQQAFSINPMSGDAMVINVNRSTIPMNQASGLTIATNMPIATNKTISLTAGNDTVESFNVTSGPDLALDPNLDLSAQHAPAGDTVVVTATLSNLGRGPTANTLQVCFYSGVSPNGTQLGCDTAPAGTILTFNTSMMETFNITSSGGQQPIYAQVTNNGDNGDPTNDVATGAIGSIPAPTLTSISEEKVYLVNTLGVHWVPPLVPGVLGFRILRSTTPGGPYELVGETSTSYLPDLMLTRGVNYCYVAQAYDAAGTLSSLSNEICASLVRLQSFVPIVAK